MATDLVDGADVRWRRSGAQLHETRLVRQPLADEAAEPVTRRAILVELGEQEVEVRIGRREADRQVAGVDGGDEAAGPPVRPGRGEEPGMGRRELAGVEMGFRGGKPNRAVERSFFPACGGVADS